MGKHRIGAVTSGALLILFGLLFLLKQFVPAIGYLFIFRLWPIIFIALGVEILYADWKSETEFTYDFLSLFLILLLAFFAIAMAGFDTMLQHYPLNLKI